MAKKKNQEPALLTPPDESPDKFPVTDQEANDTLHDMADGLLNDPKFKETFDRTSTFKKVLNEADEAPEPPQKKSQEDTEGEEESEADEEADLDDQLGELASQFGVDPQLVEGCESVKEAQRFIDRYFKTMLREGEAYSQPQVPQASEPKPSKKKSKATPEDDEEEDEDEFDFSVYDKDDPLVKSLKAQQKKLKKLEAERESDKQREQERLMAQAQQQAQQAAYAYRDELQKMAPELFGNERNQTRRQALNEEEAFRCGDMLVRGFASSGRPIPPLAVIAKQALRLSFSEEVSSKKTQAKREAEEARASRRAVGSPGRQSKSEGNQTPTVFSGPASEDPELKRLVAAKWRQRVG